MLRRRWSHTKGSERSIRSALKDAVDEAERRRRLVRGALLGLGCALIPLALLLLHGPR